MHVTPAAANQPKKLITLIRVSTQTQADAETPEVQLSALRAYARQAFGFELEDIVSVTTSRGDLASTTEWRDRIEPALAAGADLLVYRGDRLLGSDLGDATALRDIYRSKRSVYYPGGELRTDTAEARLQLRMLDAFADFERTRIKERMIAGHTIRRARGEWTLGKKALPRGITYDRSKKTYGYNQEAENIRTAYKSALDGATITDIARALNVTLFTAGHILRNPVYKGVFIYANSHAQVKHEGKVIGKKHTKRAPADVVMVRWFGGDGQEAPLIDEPTWNAVQARLNVILDTHTKVRADAQADRPWTGILMSGRARLAEGLDGDISSHVLYAKSKNGGIYYTCRCSVAPRAGQKLCGQGSVPAKKVHAWIDAQLTRATNDPWLREQVLEHVEEHNTARAAQVDVTMLDQAISKARRRLTRLRDAHLAGDYDDAADEYKSRLETARAELARLESQKETASIPQEPPVSLDLVTQYMDGIVYDANWQGSQKREWARKHLARLTVTVSGIQSIVLRLPGGLMFGFDGDAAAPPPADLD